MARPSATAALLLLFLSLLAVAHCRTIAAAADHDTEPESTAAVAINDDEKAATDEESLSLPSGQNHDFEFLRLPSHRIHHRHRPCSLHRHLWWKPHHGLYRDAPRRLHDHGERREAVSRLDILPGAEAREAEEVKPVAEPDPDRSLPDSDGEGELVASREPSSSSSFADADGHDGERAAAVRMWKKEMLRRSLHFHFHHGMRHHRLHHVHDDDDEEEEAVPEGMKNMKRFHFHHHHHDEEEEDGEKNMMRKRLRHAEHNDHEDEEVEEMVRRFRKAVMRKRFGHGRRFFHHIHHRHRHAKEAEKQAAGGDEQSGVMAWIKGLMNRL